LERCKDQGTKYKKTRKIDDKDSSSHSEVLVTQSRGRSNNRGPGKEKEVEGNKKPIMLILCVIIAMKKATSSGTVNKGGIV
jgi:hypothetical protein